MTDDWLARAACRGVTTHEFVDVDPEVGEALVHKYYSRCVVVGDCLSLAGELLPLSCGSVFAGRYWPKRSRPEVAPSPTFEQIIRRLTPPVNIFSGAESSRRPERTDR